MTAATLSVAIPAAATISVAALSALAAYLATRRDRRRTLYSEAVKAAVAWEEMLYRVRRREAGTERDLVQSFHEIQDQQAYYRAWIGSESQYMKRSYDRLISEVKSTTSDLILEAWDKPVRPLPANALPDDDHPDVDACIDAFLADVRSHLSPWPWRKLAVAWRNRKQD